MEKRLAIEKETIEKKFENWSDINKYMSFFHSKESFIGGYKQAMIDEKYLKPIEERLYTREEVETLVDTIKQRIRTGLFISKEAYEAHRIRIDEDFYNWIKNLK